MMHPVGSLPPAVYWRRRLIMVVLALALISVTVYLLRPSDPSQAAATATTSHAAPTRPAAAVDVTPSTPAATKTSAAPTAAAPATAATTTAATAAPAAACVLAALQVAAVTLAPNFAVGDKPTLYLQVTNTGASPCVQDLADSQIELRVYNGESRVWGSHDCQVIPGKTPSTLLPNVAVRIGVQWSGLGSQPQCAGTRQRVGAGSYTLYALLAGTQGTAASFTIG